MIRAGPGALGVAEGRRAARRRVASSVSPRARLLALLGIALPALLGCHRQAQPTVLPNAGLAAAEQPSAAPPPSWLDGDTASNAASVLPPGSKPVGPDPMAAQIKSERLAQQSLPKSGDPLWTLLRTSKISVDPKTGYYTAQHPPAVRALDGQVLTITGFMLPIEQDVQTRHFLVSRYTPVCFFCPPGDPNEVVEVRTLKPRPASYDMVKVTGTFSIADNGEKGLFFRLESDE